MATKNFTDAELACKHCGREGVDPDAVDKLQELRDKVGKPLVINSAYRCPIHNREVGGKPQSRHLYGDAFDISLSGHDKWDLLIKAKEVGFTGFGKYNTFLHVDTWKPRTWGSWED